MNLDKACTVLRDLIDGGENDTLKYAQVSALLSEFERKNRDSLTGATVNTYAAEKITAVRASFQILCGLSDDPCSPQGIRSNLHQDIGKLEMIVSPDGHHLQTP